MQVIRGSGHRARHPNDLAGGDKFYAKTRNKDASPPGPGTGLSCIHGKSRVITYAGG